MEHFAKRIRFIPDWPKKGVVFRDITTLLQDKHAFRDAVRALAAPFKGKVDVVAGMEARGFIFGAAVAHELGAGFVPVRKKGKLPWKTLRVEYDLEYGKDCLEIHEDAFKPGSRVLVVDDLLATGGTAQATAELIEKLGGKVVALAFLIELGFLRGREKLGGYEVYSLVNYEKE